MFLRCNRRVKDGKEHRYWNIVENRRVASGKTIQQQVLYLGEINDRQRQRWQKSIELFEDGQPRPRQVALFAEDAPPAICDEEVARIRLEGLEPHRPRQWGACWLACHLYELLALDRFWKDELPAGRKGTRWDLVLQVLVCYRLIELGSEWRLHRHWFETSAMGDLLRGDSELTEIHKLYRCHDYLLEHKQSLFEHLQERWKDLFNAKFEILLYDLTSTYFESDPPEDPQDKRKFGYSRDKRFDRVQVVIALVVTLEGFPLGFEVMSGNTRDSNTLEGFLKKIEQAYGSAERTWIMDRGIPTEETLERMRRSDPKVSYLVGTPKGRLTKLEKAFLEKPWREVRENLDVKLLERDGELYILARSQARVRKERAMLRRKLKKLLEAEGIARDGDAQPRRSRAQARRSQAGSGPRLASGGHRPARCRSEAFARNLFLLARPKETAPVASTRGTLSASQQSLQCRSCAYVEALHPAHRDRGSLQDPQRRPRP